MGFTRRATVLSFLASAMAGAQETPEQQQHHLPLPPNPNEDPKLPNGKSQKDAIAQHDHEQALKEAQQLVDLANDIQHELEKAGNYVVPLSTLRKTEEIEKLARHIRGQLKS